MINSDMNFAQLSLKSSAELRAKLISFHSGEKGRFNENQISKILRRFLPRKMDIGTGFIACSDDEQTVSPQQDIIIYDSWNNIPLFHDEVLDIFPIEAVYGTVEVKTTLTKKDLNDAFLANRKIRDMAETHGKFYVLPVSHTTSDGRTLAGYAEASSKTPPRFFIFAYSCDVKKLETLKDNFIELSKKTNAHCHGLCILDEDWFIARNAFDKNALGEEEVAVAYDANGFAIFINHLSSALSSMEILQANIKRYEDKKLDYSAAMDSNGEVVPFSEG